MGEEYGTACIGQLLYVMKLEAQVEVCDSNEETRWKGPAGRFPWSNMDLEVVQLDAVGEDSFRIVTDSDRTAWK